jgi:pSer/pThr/pTyr-binding forkhead associated (FHA) protein
MIMAPVNPAKPAPQAPPRTPARLVVASSPELREGSVISLTHEVVVGRDSSLDISLPADGYASGRHARFVRNPDGDLVEDLRSTNGTFVNGERLSGARPLRSGDLITIGQTQFTYEAGAT